MQKMSPAQISAIAIANASLTSAGLPTINEMLGTQANAVQQCLRQVVQIEIRSVYGVDKIYPVNEQAKLLALIAGTKTLTNETLAYAERMGFSIEQAPPVTFQLPQKASV